jgi:uncharacterized protein (DUF952 family)
MIYRIESEEAWQQAATSGTYLPDDYETEGFIHCSAREQVADVADRVHHGDKGLVLLCISQKALMAETRWELSGGLYYPHIYGPVNASAVVAVLPFPCKRDGTFILPAGMPDDSLDLPKADTD